MKQKLTKFLFLLTFLILSVKVVDVAVAGFKDGVYINIYGSGFVDCGPNEDCNKYAVGDYCKPDSGTCSAAGTDYWVYKYECDGRDPKNECGGNGVLPARLTSKVKGGSLSIDVSCGKTVQLDVFTKDCAADPNNWSCGDEDTKDYMAWYSGDCPAAPAPSSAPVVACNTDCSSDPTICSTATDGCTACNTSTGKCEDPSGPPPGNSGDPVPSPTTPPLPTTPPATPTPTFSENWCKCDAITVSQLIAGQPAIFTATGKVEAPHTDQAKVRDITFQIFEGGTKRIAGPETVPAQQISATSSLVQYQSQWTWNVPANVQKGVTYTAQAKIKCVPTQTAMGLPFTTMVMGASSENKGLFAVILDSFRNIFGGDNLSDPAQGENNQSPVQSVLAAQKGKENLQLGELLIGKVVENTCNYVRFSF